MTRFLFGSSAGGHVATPVTIANGGTGQTSAQAALDALAAASGSLVQGDILIVDASANLVRLARGTDNYVLTMNGSNQNWEAASAGVSLSGDNTWTGTNQFQDEVSISAGDCLTFELSTRTISSGAITGNGNSISVDTEASASSDDLNQADFSGSAVSGSVFYLKAFNDGRTVVVKDGISGTGEFLGSGDFSLDNGQDVIAFSAFYGLTNNYEVSRSDNL